MKALVTGGAGFIGSHLCERLVRDGHQVRVLDDFSNGRRENLAEAKRLAASGAGAIGSGWGALEVVNGSVVDLEMCRRACEGVDAVFHHAAIASVPESVEDPLRSHAANLTGTLNLLVAAKEARDAGDAGDAGDADGDANGGGDAGAGGAGGGLRFVMAASTSAYGNSEEIPTSETARTDPQSPYAVQKLGSELYCSSFHRLYGLETYVLRYFNIFGPRQDPESPYGAVVPKFVSALVSGEAPEVHGDGEQSRDFTYVDNVVEANLAAVRAPASAAGQVYNIASGRSYSVNELLEALVEVVGSSLTE